MPDRLKQPGTINGIVAIVAGLAVLIGRVATGVPDKPPDWAFNSPILYCVFPAAAILLLVGIVGLFLKRIFRGDEVKKFGLGQEGLTAEFAEVIKATRNPLKILRRVVNSELPQLNDRIYRAEKDIRALKGEDDEVDNVPALGTSPKE